MTALFIRPTTTASERETHSVDYTGAATEPILIKSESGISWRTQITGRLTGATQTLDKRYFLFSPDQIDTIITFREYVSKKFYSKDWNNQYIFCQNF